MRAELLALATGARIDRAARFADALSAAMGFYSIDTSARQAAFLSQIGHETLGLRYVAEIWGPTDTQRRYERDFAAPWPTTDAESHLDKFETNRLAYTLGNHETGDGERFRGHGLLQTTGRFNHARVRDRLRERFAHLTVPDFEDGPGALMLPQWAALSAADYWDEHRLNAFADAGDVDGVSDGINRGHKTAALGDANGYADRLARYQTALRALALA
jgi:putative chitinase